MDQLNRRVSLGVLSAMIEADLDLESAASVLGVSGKVFVQRVLAGKFELEDLAKLGAATGRDAYDMIAKRAA